MPYTQPTYTEAKDALASRLNDAGKVRWVDEELGLYIRESLRTWSAWTQSFRAQGLFDTVTLQTFYDLPTVIPTLRGYTVTNWDLIRDLQYALMEPAAAGGTWTGTDQFTLAQLSTAVQRRRDQFLRETGIVVTNAVLYAGLTPPGGVLWLTEDVASVRRAAWRPETTMLLLPLTRTTEWASTYFQPAWLTSTQEPTAYSVSVTPPLNIQLIPPPLGSGFLDVVTINDGIARDPVTPAVLGIPDDWTWVVKFGALADLLSGDGLALDPQRAAYCESRWQDGIDQARRSSVVLSGRINNAPCRIAALSDADSYSPLWQLLGGVPQQLVLTGGNLVGTWPPAGGTGGPWSITLDVVRNAPVPVLAGDILQIGPDIYDTILDYAQHLALVKEGPGEIEQAMGLLQRAARAAGVQLTFHQAAHPDRAALLGQTQQDRRSSPERLEDVVAIPVED